MSKSLLTAITFGAATLFSHIPPVLAHAFPDAERPPAGSTVMAPPSQVEITFDSPVESLFAKLGVTDKSGREEAAGAPVAGKDRRSLSVALKPLGAGEYTVHWSVVAEDGHRTQGSYIFTVAGQASE